MEVDSSKGYGEGEYGKRVKVRDMKRVKVKVGIYKVQDKVLSRYGGGDKYGWGGNGNGNGGLKESEKRLVCEVEVVGRGMVGSWEIMGIDNVGKGW